MSLKAVLFDLDETLTMHERPFEEAYLATCLPAALRHNTHAAGIVVAQYAASDRLCNALQSRPFLTRIGIGGRDILWGDADGDTPELAALAAETPAFRLAVWQAALAGVGIQDDPMAQRMAAAFPEEMRARVAAYPDATRCVEAVAARYKVAIVTNGLAGPQVEKLRRGGLDRFFRTVAVSGSVGQGKPHPAVFEAALSELSVDAADALMVGDVVKRDIAGAQALGMRTVWINRHGLKRDSSSPTPDAEIASLEELPALL